MNVIIDPKDKAEYPITSEIGRNILKNYLTNYKNGGEWSVPTLINVQCSTNSVSGSVMCSSDPKFAPSPVTQPPPRYQAPRTRYQPRYPPPTKPLPPFPTVTRVPDSSFYSPRRTAARNPYM